MKVRPQLGTSSSSSSSLFSQPANGTQRQALFTILGFTSLLLVFRGIELDNGGPGGAASITGTAITDPNIINHRHPSSHHHQHQLDPDILNGIFQKHCNGWTLSPAFLAEFNTSNDYSVPLLVKAAMENCPESSLPYTGVDLWQHQANVIMMDDIWRWPREQMVKDLHQKCNDESNPHACIIFMESTLMRTNDRGAALLLQVIQQPFVLITGDNTDVCMPYPVIHHGNGEDAAALDIDDLIRSPLLIRWYSKNMCLHQGHSAGKLVSLPIGIKWQWRSIAFEGEVKEPMKRDIYEAGSMDPRDLFLHQKERTAYVAMDVTTTDNSNYPLHEGLRRTIMGHIESTMNGRDSTTTTEEDRFTVLHATGASHADYMKGLAKAAFVMCPPGRGIDAHRTWEALALGAIPIVMRDPLSPLYQHLPVVIISDIKELTPENLKAWYRMMHEEDRVKGYQWQRVTAFYWLQHIVLDTRKKAEVFVSVYDRKK